GNRLDGVFNGIYGLACPAGGYDFLQGPVDNMDIDGDGDVTEFLGMTSFTYFGAGSSISDPSFSYAGSLQFFNLMEGFLPRPEYPVQIPWTDPATGEETKFALSGDPVSGSGWVDGVQLPPGDRRLVMASGPFNMVLGDDADVVIALAAGTGLDAVSSVSVAKYVDTYAQYAYDNNFSLPSAPTSPSVTGVEMDGRIALDWGSNSSAVSSTEETVSAGFEFEGYNVYQLPGAGSPLTEGVKVATYDKVNLVQNILDPTVDPLTGLVVDAAKQTGTNSGVQRYFTTDYDEIRGRPMSNGISYYFAITAYSFLSDNEGSPFKTLESGAAGVTVVPHDANPGLTVNNEIGSDVAVTHSGTANAEVIVNILNSDNLKDDTYKVSFDQQHFYRDLAGIWQKSDTPGRTAGKIMDCSPSTVSAAAIASADVGTIDLVLTFDLVCPGGAWIDGVQFEFPEGFASNVNSWAITGGGNVCSYGTDSGQNCENLDGSWTGDVLLFGTEATGGGFGAFESSNIFTVNVNPWYAGDLEALAVGYTVWDDGYDGTTVNGEGTSTITELGYEFKTETHWNLSNSSGTVLLQDQTFVNGADIYGGASVDNMSLLHYNSAAAVTVDGFQVNVNGGYSAPSDFFGITYDLDEAAAAMYGDAIYDMDSYAVNGWALTAMAVDTWGSGITSVDILQRDIQLRFTGEFEPTPTVTAAGVVYYPALSTGGSMAWIDGSRISPLAEHPSPNNPGTGDPFRIRIPFEVWDMEAPGGEQQIDITIYDRVQSYASGDTVYAFNPYGRMYTHFIHLPHQENGEYADLQDNLTWNVVWWSAMFNQGDVLTLNYANPIQASVDEFSFTMQANDAAASNDVADVSVYPNPYYGFHELETSRADKYVSFNHLPSTATINIYSLGGTFVKRIEKTDDGSQFTRWDLKNQYGYPVASGLYIVSVESGGEEKILKLALVQETQVLKYY
ncbi:MAG TPA: T9SS type A sorting domain-containing protein, partial [Candidatus Marinimicrobia bacterium]|nr:T9SS type A sorting domain-containing protein [Candidatus Neomarinimicrobiota bacterium]